MEAWLKDLNCADVATVGRINGKSLQFSRIKYSVTRGIGNFHSCGTDYRMGGFARISVPPVQQKFPE